MIAKCPCISSETCHTFVLHPIFTIKRYRSRICEGLYTIYCSTKHVTQGTLQRSRGSPTSLYCNETAASLTSCPGPFGIWQPFNASFSKATPASCHSTGCVRPRPLVHLLDHRTLSVNGSSIMFSHAQLSGFFTVCVAVIVGLMLLKKRFCCDFAQQEYPSVAAQTVENDGSTSRAIE